MSRQLLVGAAVSVSNIAIYALGWRQWYRYRRKSRAQGTRCDNRWN
jgi:hypothetical protein